MNVVMKWNNGQIKFVKYGSSLQFKQLLNCFESPAVQIFAIWTLHELFAQNRKNSFLVFNQILNYFFLFS